jgi:hypothetical protein
MKELERVYDISDVDAVDGNLSELLTVDNTGKIPVSISDLSILGNVGLCLELPFFNLSNNN